MFELLLAIVGFVLLVAGGFRYGLAVDHLKPEFRDWRGMTLYWRVDRFTPDGQRILRSAQGTQLAGLALLALAAWLS